MPADTTTATNDVSSSQSSLHPTCASAPREDPVYTPSTVSKSLPPASIVSTPAAAGTTRNQSVLPIGAPHVSPASPDSINALEVEPLSVAGSARLPAAGNASLACAPAVGEELAVGLCVGVCAGVALGVAEAGDVAVRIAVAEAAVDAVGDGVRV